jgi:hypothetical protein
LEAVKMASNAWLSLLSALLGGSVVSLVTFFAGRDKTRAETRKLEAETARIKAETTSMITGQSLISVGQSPIPAWRLSGSRPEDYSIAIDYSIAYSGSASALLEAQFGARGFATLMQKVSAVKMRGKRIRMSAYTKAEDVRQAGLWMRVDEPEKAIMGFDNMESRPIKGTHSWRRHEVVLDVPAASLYIAFGVLLVEQGRIWVDKFEFQEVDDVPSADIFKGLVRYPGPMNLDFEDKINS